MASELRKTILEREDTLSESVTIEEWDVTVEVRGMTAGDRFRLLQTSSVDGKVNFQRWFPDLVIACTYDPDTGEKVFEPADRDTLLTRSGRAVGQLAEVASRLSGLSDTDVEAAKATFQEG
jgi:hypothetical protein